MMMTHISFNGNAKKVTSMDMPWYWNQVPHPSNDGEICKVTIMTEEERKRMDELLTRRGIVKKDKDQGLREAKLIQLGYHTRTMKMKGQEADVDLPEDGWEEEAVL